MPERVEHFQRIGDPKLLFNSHVEPSGNEFREVLIKSDLAFRQCALLRLGFLAIPNREEMRFAFGPKLRKLPSEPKVQKVHTEGSPSLAACHEGEALE